MTEPALEANPIMKPASAQTTLINLCDIVLDPKSVVDRLSHRSAWLYPYLITVTGTIVIGAASQPLLNKVIEAGLPLGIPDDQARQAIDSIVRYRRVGLYLCPLGIPLKWLASTALLFISCLMLDIRVAFKDLFALISQCGLIILFQELILFVIAGLKGDQVRTVEDLSPKIGLDLLFSTSSRPVLLALNYFSIFNLAYILILTITLAKLGRCSTIRAFLATMPNWLLPLGFGLGLLIFKNG